MNIVFFYLGEECLICYDSVVSSFCGKLTFVLSLSMSMYPAILIGREVVKYFCRSSTSKKPHKFFEFILFTLKVLLLFQAIETKENEKAPELKKRRLTASN